MTAVFTGPDGQEKVVPAYWAGGSRWGLRFSSHAVGRHRFRTQCSDPGNADLHDREELLEVIPYHGENSVAAQGPLRTSEAGPRLEHVDGTPLFWLGDTWWMGLTRRLPWPDGFQALAADRVAKGFTVI